VAVSCPLKLSKSAALNDRYRWGLPFAPGRRRISSNDVYFPLGSGHSPQLSLNGEK
jgi:hypothetical protein